MHDNIQRTIHLIVKVSKFKIPAILVELDAEKAFDRVDWSFLFLTMQRFGFGDRFINMVRANYKHPHSRVQVNGSPSLPFALSRGSGQGCSLSPLLFAISIEPLAIQFRANPEIKGI